LVAYSAVLVTHCHTNIEFYCQCSDPVFFPYVLIVRPHVFIPLFITVMLFCDGYDPWNSSLRTFFPALFISHLLIPKYGNGNK